MIVKFFTVKPLNCPDRFRFCDKSLQIFKTDRSYGFYMDVLFCQYISGDNFYNAVPIR